MAAWRKVIGGGAVAAVMLTGLAGCGGGAQTSATGSAGSASQGGGAQSGGHVITIGAAVSYSGPLVNEGTMMRHGYELWASEVNKRGGIDVGGTKYQVKLDLIDDKGQTQTAADLVEKLITQDKVNFVFGPYGSGLTSVASAVSEKYHRIMIAPTSNAPSVYSRGFKYLFGILPAASKGIPTELDALEKASNGQAKRIAVIWPDDVFPTASAQAVLKHAKELGLDVVYQGKYPKGSKDLTPILSQVKSAHPDALINTGYVEDQLLTVRQSKQLQMHLKFLGMLDLPFDGKGVWGQLGTSANGITGMNWFDPSETFKGTFFGTSAQYGKLYESKYHQQSNYYDAASAAAGVVLADAIQKAGSLNNDKVAQVLRSMTFKTFFGNIHFGADGLNDNGAAVVGQIQNAKLALVWPPSAASGKLQYPMP